MKTTIAIQNLKCGGCAHTITSKLSEIKNITNVNVSVEMSTVSFDYNSKTDVSLVETKLKSLGYPTKTNDNNMVLKAKSMFSCAAGKISK